jgi:acyl-CoA thioester hydrolase
MNQVTAEHRPQPLERAAFRHFIEIATRWMDNDMYGHLNNVVYYSLFDTVVNRMLIERGMLDPQHGDIIGLVVHTQCHYFAPISFPQPVAAGLKVARIGQSSVRYAIGLFPGDAARTAAHGEFTHVYVDRRSRRPMALPPGWRETLAALS